MLPIHFMWKTDGRLIGQEPQVVGRLGKRFEESRQLFVRIGHWTKFLIVLISTHSVWQQLLESMSHHNSNLRLQKHFTIISKVKTYWTLVRGGEIDLLGSIRVKQPNTMLESTPIQITTPITKSKLSSIKNTQLSLNKIEKLK